MAVSKSTARAAAVTPDERQREAIEHVHGPLLVVAGAGTGKTTVLTRRIAALIRNGHARPSEILALTYTDNAAKEMRERVQAELRGTDVSSLRAVTFHESGERQRRRGRVRPPHRSQWGARTSDPDLRNDSP